MLIDRFLAPNRSQIVARSIALTCMQVIIGSGCTGAIDVKHMDVMVSEDVCRNDDEGILDALRIIRADGTEQPAAVSSVVSPTDIGSIRKNLEIRIRENSSVEDLASYLASAADIPADAACLTLKAWTAFMAHVISSNSGRGHELDPKTADWLSKALKIVPDSPLVVRLNSSIRGPGVSDGRLGGTPTGLIDLLESCPEPGRAAIVAWVFATDIDPLLPELAALALRDLPQHPLAIAIDAFSRGPTDPGKVGRLKDAVVAFNNAGQSVSLDAFVLLAELALDSAGSADKFGEALALFNSLPDPVRQSLMNGYTGNTLGYVLGLPFEGRINDIRLELAAIGFLGGDAALGQSVLAGLEPVVEGIPSKIAGSRESGLKVQLGFDEFINPYRHLIFGLRDGISRDQLFEVAVETNIVNTSPLPFWNAFAARVLYDAGFVVYGVDETWFCDGYDRIPCPGTPAEALVPTESTTPGQSSGNGELSGLMEELLRFLKFTCPDGMPQTNATDTTSSGWAANERILLETESSLLKHIGPLPCGMEAITGAELKSARNGTDSNALTVVSIRLADIHRQKAYFWVQSVGFAQVLRADKVDGIWQFKRLSKIWR